MNKTIFYCCSTSFTLMREDGPYRRWCCAQCGQVFSVSAPASIPTPHEMHTTVAQLVQPTTADNYGKPVQP